MAGRERDMGWRLNGKQKNGGACWTVGPKVIIFSEESQGYERRANTSWTQNVLE